MPLRGLPREVFYLDSCAVHDYKHSRTQVPRRLGCLTEFLLRISLKMANRFEDLLKAPAADRKQVAERLYDVGYGKRLELPSKLRLKRIALYKTIIGAGHQQILELGCGSGDLTYQLIDNAARIVATDISHNAIELAEKRKELWPLSGEELSKIEFRQMSAVHLDLHGESSRRQKRSVDRRQIDRPARSV